jgi:hypothetical protein
VMPLLEVAFRHPIRGALAGLPLFANRCFGPVPSRADPLFERFQLVDDDQNCVRCTHPMSQHEIHIETKPSAKSDSQTWLSSQYVR